MPGKRKLEAETMMENKKVKKLKVEKTEIEGSNVPQENKEVKKRGRPKKVI